MPPTLRSSTSAQNSPSSNKMNLRSSNTTPSTTPTRKVPQCAKCKRPRAGHPRTGCPFTDSPPMNKLNLPSAADSSGHLTDALGSMIIAGPDSTDQEEDDKDMKAFIRNRRRKSAQPLLRNESLLSLSTNSNEIIIRLSQPGIFNDNTEEDIAEDGKAKASRIVRWQEIIAATPIAAKRTTQSKTPGALMPGTLILPTPESSFASSNTESCLKMETPSANAMELHHEPSVELESSQGQSSSSASQSTVRRRAAPLSRTMSAVERDVFVSKLSGEAPATIYIIPKADVDVIASQATALKFITELIMNDNDEDPNALIILGREENAVQSLLRKIEKESRKVQASKAKGSSTLKTAAGAAVVGAVGAWAGLAFT